MTREFYPIPGFPGYGISVDGDVWSEKTEKILRVSPGSTGYAQINLRRNGRTVHTYVHRLMGRTFLEQNEAVNHKNGQKMDNRLSNLESCTFGDNVRHAYATGLIKIGRGLQNPNARFTAEQIHEIRNLHAKGWTNPKIGAIMGVTGESIRKILNGSRYQDVPLADEQR